MLKKITIAENSLDPSTWVEYETENILDFLVEHFGQWPEGARLYNKDVSEVTDITPGNINEIEAILEMDGPFYVVIFPGGQAYVIWAIVIALIAVAIVLLAPTPKIPNIAIRNSDNNPSSNNQLSNRVNKERINSRIPDIYGQVRSVPDLIALPYRYFVNNIEVEHTYMCIGRGEFEIEDYREDTTSISAIEGASAEFYAPNTSPNSGDGAFLTIGKPIATEIKLVKKFGSVNGQVLAPEQLDSFSTILTFTQTSTIIDELNLGQFSIKFNIGDTIIIEYAYEWGEEVGFSGHFILLNNYSGSYLITNVTNNIITVSNAASNSDWNALIIGLIDSNPIESNIRTTEDGFTGPFIVDRSDTEEIWCNFVAINGIYKDDGTSKTSFPVKIITKITPVDLDDVATGSPEEFETVLLWSGTYDLGVGATLKAIPTFSGRCSVQCRRITPKTIVSGSQIVEEVKWRDLFGVSLLTQTDFGNVTTVQTLSVANSASLNVKERKFNTLLTRKIPARISGSTFSTELYATKQADEIISHICLDDFIGARTVSEVDFDSIYSTIAEINSYFGTVTASEFSYTFDSSNLSFEEIFFSIANSIFSIAYRRGSKLKLSFEKENENSTILFNHRNKIPGTENRTIIFGNTEDNDGVEFQYVDSEDDSIVSIYLPSDKSARNPKIVESIGIRNFPQAHFQANRIFNKIKYKTQSIEVEVTQESSICVINDRILISDGTRSGSFEGEVINQNLLELTLSKNLNLLEAVAYTIFLQYIDGTVESMPISKTDTANKIILSQAPSMPLALDSDLYARTTFLITPNNDTRKTAFILTEKNPKSIMTSDIKGVNYDARYYFNDLDLINSIITE